DVQRRLAAALDLEACDADVSQLANFTDSHQVAHAEGLALAIGRVESFATEVGALAALAAAPHLLAGERAQAAVAVAQAAVDEDLELDVGGALDGLDFVQREFASQDRALKAVALGPAGALRGVDQHLGAGVPVEARE